MGKVAQKVRFAGIVLQKLNLSDALSAAGYHRAIDAQEIIKCQC